MICKCRFFYFSSVFHTRFDFSVAPSNDRDPKGSADLMRIVDDIRDKKNCSDMAGRVNQRFLKESLYSCGVLPVIFLKK